MTEPILEAVEIEYTYPDGTKALNKVNMSIARAEKIAVLGSNGAGKSTLFLHFNGIFCPNGGKIRYKGKDISYQSKALHELRREVGIVFQDPDSQLFSASVFQEVSFGPMNLGLPEDEVRRRVVQALKETEIQDLTDRPVHMLSFGQKKRVSIADILAMEPQVIIFDEPAAGLDPRHATELMQLLDKLSEQGRTLILSTHDVNLAYAWADRIFIMQQGKVTTSGCPREVFREVETIKNADLNQPWLVEIHHDLVELGYLKPEAPLPKTKEELWQGLKTIT